MRKSFAYFAVFAFAAVAAFFGHHDGGLTVAVMGATVNQETLDSASRGFRAIFKGAFDGAVTAVDKLYFGTTSKGKVEEYKFLHAFPGLREWIGDRQVKNLSGDGFLIKNRDFEATVAVDRNDIEDDSIGVYTGQFAQLGQSAKQHPGQLVIELLTGGFTNSCFDGKFFFDTAHPNGAQAAFSNKFTGVLSAANYEVARAAMMSYVNDAGKSLGVMPNTLIVPPQLEATARALLRADKTANGATNIWLNSADILVMPELAAHPTWWFLADLSKVYKPFVFQSRKVAEFVAMDKPTDENVFNRKEFRYGVDYRGNAGYGLPHLIAGSNGTV